jgi:hypothetical protein
VEFTTEVDGAFVSKWEALEKVNKDPAAEYGIFCARKPAEKLVTGSQDN